MNKKKSIFYFWLCIFSLLLLPVTNSFIVNLRKTVSCVYDNKRLKYLENSLSRENSNLSEQLRYYKSSQGIKALAKDRLNKVEEGEILIKYKGKISP